MSRVIGTAMAGVIGVALAGLIGMALEPRDTPDQAFRYRSLSTRSGRSITVKVTDEADIRLLELLPSEASDARIRCRLHHYLLFPTQQKWKQDFHALSYTWGNGDQDRLIIIDGKGFLVAENLELALWRLRLPDRSVFLWIDAICINQRDILEKQEQISMMGDIYGIATKVVAWLGEEADNSDLVPPFAQLLIDILLPLEETLRIEAEDLTRIGLPPPTDRRWKALRDLFSRSWFSRKWIIQEFAMAKAVDMVCGPWTFEFELSAKCLLAMFAIWAT